MQSDSHPAAREFHRIVQEWYPIARRGILLYEAAEGRKAVEGITELRDALDHFWKAGTAEGEQEMDAHLRLAEDHIRTAAVETIERAVEQRLYYVRSTYLRMEPSRHWWRSWGLSLAIPDPSAVQESEDLIRDHIRSGRELKSDIATASQSVEEFRLAYMHTRKLERLFQPEKQLDRTFDVRLAGVGIIVSLILGLIGGILIS